MYLLINVDLDPQTKSRVHDRLQDLLNDARTVYMAYKKTITSRGTFYSMFIQPYLNIFGEDVRELLRSHHIYTNINLSYVKLSFAVSENTAVNEFGFRGDNSFLYSANTSIDLSFINLGPMKIELKGTPVISQRSRSLVQSCIVRILQEGVLEHEP
jgi:hypothetical protein